MTSESEPESQQHKEYVPFTEYQEIVNKLNTVLNDRSILTDRVDQLEEALTKVGMGIHKASEQNEKRSLVLRIATWRRAREMAMNLLHVPVGADETQIEIISKGDELIEILPRQKE